MRHVLIPALFTVFALSGTVLSGTVLSGPAFAQAQPPILSLPEGQTVLNVMATERIEVQQDLLVASMRIEKQGADPKTIQNDINVLMKSALEKAKAVNAVEVSTEQYYVYPEYEQPVAADRSETQPKPQKWRGSQSIKLQSKNSDALLKLTGELQAMGLMMSNMSYMLSPTKSDEVSEGLMENAIAKVRKKAERAAKAMSKTQTELLEVTVDTAAGVQAQPYMMRASAMEMKQDSMAAPSAEPGMTEVTLTVSARALLKP